VAPTTSGVKHKTCDRRRGCTGGDFARVAAPGTPPGDVVHVLTDFWLGDTFGATFTSIGMLSGLRNQ
jgi:hypothetical protein